MFARTFFAYLHIGLAGAVFPPWHSPICKFAAPQHPSTPAPTGASRRSGVRNPAPLLDFDTSIESLSFRLSNAAICLEV